MLLLYVPLVFNGHMFNAIHADVICYWPTYALRESESERDEWQMFIYHIMYTRCARMCGWYTQRVIFDFDFREKSN